MAPHEVDANPITLPPLSAARFSATGLTISDPTGLLSDLGAERAPANALQLANSGVQQAPVGIIQDPAGSAVGSPTLGGGGASGAIYGAFPDLAPIPAIQPRSAIFNGSDGAGRRVLHSHSPRLSGQPIVEEDRRRALEDIANTYANAIHAYNARADAQGLDGQPLNLVPVAGAIFAGAFQSPAFPPHGHLDPSYTICALYLAVAGLEREDHPIPPLVLHYFDKGVFLAAQTVMAHLGA